MTALQEAPDIADIIAGALQVSRGTAYDLMRTALAQQEADKPFQPDWVNYRQGVEDGKAEALLAQQGEQQQVVKEVVVHADYRAMWQEVTRQNQQLCAALSAAPAPQAQGETK